MSRRIIYNRGRADRSHSRPASLKSRFVSRATEIPRLASGSDERTHAIASSCLLAYRVRARERDREGEGRRERMFTRTGRPLLLLLPSPSLFSFQSRIIYS